MYGVFQKSCHKNVFFLDLQGILSRNGPLFGHFPRKLVDEIKVLSNCGLLRHVRSTDIVQILQILTAHIKFGCTHKILCNPARSKMKEILSALDAISLAMYILTSSDMSREIYREDVIEELVNAVQHHLTCNVFLFFSGSGNSYKALRSTSFQQDATNDDDSDAKSKSGKFTDAEECRVEEESQVDDDSVIVKQIRQSKAFDVLVNLLATILRQLANLLSIIPVPSSTVYQVMSVCMASFTIEGIDLIHPNAVEVVVSAFKNYPEHRSFIIDDALATFLKLPASGRRLRRLLLPQDDSISIQVISAVLLRCIESCVALHPNLKSVAEIKDMATLSNHETGCGPAFHWSHYFWKEFLLTWHSAKVQDFDFKGRLSNVVSDLLTVLNMPEWPGASLVLLSLSSQLLSSRGISSTEIKVREVALDILGQIATKVKKDSVACERDDLVQSLAYADVHGKKDTHLSKSTSSALKSARQDAGFVRNTCCTGVDSESSFADGPDMLTLECMHLWNVCQAVTQETISHEMEIPAVAFSLAQLTRESEWNGLGFRSEFDGPGGNPIMYRTLYDRFKSRVTGDSSTDTFGTRLSRPIAIRLCRILQQRYPLARQFDVLLRRILGALEDAAISVRAAAVRALAGVIDADFRLLNSDRMRLMMARRLSDNGTMVRHTMVDMLGKHVVRHPGVPFTYHDAIVERLSDVGVSVRRRVVHVLREYLCASEDSNESNQILSRLAFRIFDDDPAIQELVVGIFREAWLQFDDNELTPNAKVVKKFGKSAAQCAKSFVEVIWKIYWSVSRTGMARLPLLPSFPIIVILRRAIFSQDSQHVRGHDADCPALLVDQAQRLCRAVINHFLHHEEKPECHSFEFGGIRSKDVGDHASFQQGLSLFPIAVRYALGVHVICATDRRLCVPANHPLEFAMAVHPYLKKTENTSINSMQLQCCISVVDAVVSETTITSCVANEVEKDLRVLLLRSTYHGVLHYASRCLCTVARNSPKSPMASGALQVSRRFLKFLNGVKEKYGISQEETAHVSRAIFVLGNLSRYGADILETSNEEALLPVSLMRLFQVFLQHSGMFGFGIKRIALQACGYVFISRAHLIITASRGFDDTSVDGIMHAALDLSADKGLKEQALLIIDEYLREDEEKSLKQIAGAPSTVPHNMTQKTRARGYYKTWSTGDGRHHHYTAGPALEHDNAKSLGDFQMVNGEHESNLSNALAQRYWPCVLALCTDFETSVRLKALHLSEIILRQGHIHPMSCFPSLIALHVDPSVTIRKLVSRLLKHLHGKHPTFFDNQLCAGAELMFVFCKKLHSGARRAQKWDKMVHAEGNKVCSTFSQPAFFRMVSNHLFTFKEPKLVRADIIDDGVQKLYKLVNKTRAARFKFIMSLLRRFEDSNRGEHIPYICFLANLIASLPFSTHDEVLFTAHHLSRIVMLRASMLPDSLKRHITLSSNEMTVRTSTEADYVAVRQDIELATIMSVTLALKLHLKRIYNLTRSRLRNYSPTEPLKPGERIRVEDRPEPLDLSWVDPDAAASFEGRVRQANLFFSLMGDGCYCSDVY